MPPAPPPPAVAPPPPAAAPTPEPAQSLTSVYDHLFDVPAPAPVAAAPADPFVAGPSLDALPVPEAAPPIPPPPVPADATLDEDHDGLTVIGLVGPPGGFQFAAPNPPTGPTVLARVCPACGTANSTRRPACARCGATLAGDAVTMPRPVLGRIQISTGESVPLDRPIIIGRKPKAPRFSNDDTPRLIQVNGPQQDISRSHLKIELEDWSVLVSDLGSTNGTILRRPGELDRRLQGSEQIVAQVGDVYDLGDGVTITVAELA